VSKFPLDLAQLWPHCSSKFLVFLIARKTHSFKQVIHLKFKALTQGKQSTTWLMCCFAAVMLLAGCSQDDQIQVYTVPKKVAYQLPSNWTKTASTSAMRLATYDVRGENGEEAEVAILPMPSLNVADHEIVNLWRSQLQLPPITKEEVEQSSDPVQIGDLQGRIFDLTAPENAPGEMSGARIITAFVAAPTGTWFFKMTGQKDHLEKEIDGFTSFLGSVDLNAMQKEIAASRTTADPHAGVNMAAASAPPTRPSTASSNLPKWTIPDSWTDKGGRSMILASFSAQGGAVEVTVSMLGGGAGGTLPNINRWRGQVGLPPASEADLTSMASSIEVGDIESTYVSLPGASQQIDAVIVPKGNQTWFFKAMGAPTAVQQETENFKSFVQSVQF
jgi:hypothetical protein